MKPETWKILAITFIVLFVCETIFVIWVYALGINEINMDTECYYDICGDYADAWREGNICYCYDYDVLGNLVMSKTEVIK